MNFLIARMSSGLGLEEQINFKQSRSSHLILYYNLAKIKYIKNVRTIIQATDTLSVVLS